ncbi:MAG: T9SS type A sorting domain-containing protein, partial [Bacteroidetes bacterium]|nr:T9SS type A sorting domain-containing protein [Bacteroidota bacterium]
NDGAIEWSKGYGGSNDEQGFSVTKTIGNGYLVAGYSESSDGDITTAYGGADAYLMNLSDTGAIIWQKNIGTAKDEIAMNGFYLDANNFTISGFAQPGTTQIAAGYMAYLGNSNIIKGTLFYDANLNGIRDASEHPFNNAMVTSEKANYQRSSMSYNGTFAIDVDTGAYITKADVVVPYYTVVPSSYNSTFSHYFNVDSFSFAIQPQQGKRDLSIISIPLTAARPGFTLQYKILYKNVGTDTVTSGSVLFVKDSRVGFNSAVPSPSQINGDTLTWSYTDFKPFDTASIALLLNVPAAPAVSINDTLVSMAVINPVSGDQTPADDTARIRQRASGSFDPNDKTEGNGGLINKSQVTGGAYLNYLIRFQNTGTDTAFNIFVRDTLDDKTDWSSLQMLDASHQYRLTITDHNKLEWSFNNINLPDSNINERLSRGYIAYRVKPKNTVNSGDTIRNSASIYFDYNLPVKTNTQLTTVSTDVITGVGGLLISNNSMKIFPNPSANNLYININERVRGNGLLRVTDLAGKSIYKELLGNIDLINYQKTINLRRFSSGVYIISIGVENHLYVQKLIIL